MFLWAFRKDIRNYTHKSVSSNKNSIWESIESFWEDALIKWVLVQLKTPKEIWGTLTKQISEHALYSSLEFDSKRGDQIIHWDVKYSVITSRVVQYFQQDDPFRIHYLQLIQ